MNIDYKKSLRVKEIRHFYGSTEDGRDFIIQAIWTMDGWKVDLIIWSDNNGDKEIEFEIKTEFLYSVNNISL
jgi:hypothetical protein